MDLKEKIETNTWDSIDDFMRVMNEAKAGNWHWFKNTKCKYVELRVDMRDGGCIIKDRYGARIDPKELAFQYGEDKPANVENHRTCAAFRAGPVDCRVGLMFMADCETL